MRPFNNYKNILVFNPSFLGDSVLTTPLIIALKQIYPNAKISFCVRPECRGLFEGLPFIDNVIVYDKRGQAKGLKGVISFARELKERNFDLVVNLHKSFRSTLLLKLSACPYIIGFKSAVMSFLFNKSVKRNMSLHEVERNLSVLSLLCKDFSLEKAKALGGKPQCAIDESVKEKIEAYYSSVTGNKKVVGIAPGSVWATKRWLPEYFAKTAHMLTEKGYAVALFGSPSDKDAIEAFYKNFRGTCYDFAMKTSVKELPTFLSSLDLFITNDSGPMHIAVGAEVPCVAIFGATVTGIGFAPYDDKSIVVEDSSLSCRPCGIHGGSKCPKGHFNCMKNVTPEIVFEAVEKILGQQQ